MKRTKVFSLIAAAVLSLALVACGNDDGDDSGSPAGGSGVTTGVSTPGAVATSSGIVGGTSAAGTGTPAAGSGIPAATATSAAAATSSAPQVIDLRAGEWYFDPKDLVMRPGTVTVRMNNVGPERPHTMGIKQRNGSGDVVRSERIEVGQTGTINFTLTEAGTYEMYCFLPGHADRGQVGTVTVRS